ncbi:MAG: FHA domain-containing protein [Gammaproteobacteria bacterium]
MRNKGVQVDGLSTARYRCIALLGAALCIFSLKAWAGQDVVVLLANSASLHANSQAITQAVIDFANSRGPDTNFAVITYSKSPMVQVPLSPIGDATRAQVSNVLRNLDYRGRLIDTTAGLKQALAEIINNGDSNTQKNIVLITNDIENTGDATADKEKTSWILQAQMPTAVYNHVRIYGITYTSNAVYKTLQVLTLGTGGNAFQIAHDSDLSGVFQRISASMLNSSTASMLISPSQIAPPGLAGASIPAQFNTPLTQQSMQSPHTRWVWLIALLALLAASIGIYAAWNIVRHIRFPKRTIKPLIHFGEGPRAVLYDISNPNDIKRHELAERSTLLGRVAGYDPEVQYVLVKEKTVGRCHAVIERRGHSFWIMDQGSINGTFVNGERIMADRALKHGDIVAIHRHEFEFMIPEYFESESTVVGAREQLAG